jgi:tricorn protease
MQAMDLRYHAWEYKTQELAQMLAREAGFSVAYIHLRSMLYMDVNDFARGFYPDYDKDALILDVRHNGGGNIDSWILTALQRKVWSYWRNRRGTHKGDIDWDEQFAFQGHVVVLVDEKTGSDGEGVARGISELGLGRLIGTRTWGGGIWLSSDNVLVDGGIATAPEMGTYNKKFGYGMGIENVGIEPDIVVDNNPKTTFDGKDAQLERAIQELKEWLQSEPVVIPTPPEFIKDVSLRELDCPA